MAESTTGVLGTEPTYADLRDAALRRLRGQGLESAGRIAQSVKSAGLRTSGVGMLPQLEGERNRAAGEADIEARLAEMRLNQLGRLGEMKEASALSEYYGMRQGERDRDFGRTSNRERLQAALIGTGAGALGGAATKYGPAVLKKLGIF